MPAPAQLLSTPSSRAGRFTPKDSSMIGASTPTIFRGWGMLLQAWRAARWSSTPTARQKLEPAKAIDFPRSPVPARDRSRGGSLLRFGRPSAGLHGRAAGNHGFARAVAPLARSAFDLRNSTIRCWARARFRLKSFARYPGDDMNTKPAASTSLTRWKVACVRGQLIAFTTVMRFSSRRRCGLGLRTC